MDKRMFGLDSEYSITCVFGGERRLPPDEVARDVFRGMASDGPLRNGARLNLKVASARRPGPGRSSTPAPPPGRGGACI